jgi:uncharacterized protein (DUF302 family)
MTRLLSAICLALVVLVPLSAGADQPNPYAPGVVPFLPQLVPPGAPNPWLQYVPNPSFGIFPMIPLIMPGQQPAPTKPYTMHRIIPEAAKIQMMQTMLPMMTEFMHMNMPEAMNWAARKIKAKPGLSFDDVKESLFLRANQLNLKKVGENDMWKDFQAVLGDKTAPRIEVYSFCDIAVARELLKIDPEFLVFLPCRIAIMQDSDKNIWVMTLDWNMDWVAGYEKQLGITDKLLLGAIDINKRIIESMKAAANGEL